MTLRLTVNHGNSVYPWNTIPRSGPGPATAWPSSKTSPPVASSSPATMRMSVDLPQPDGPTTQMNSRR